MPFIKVDYRKVLNLIPPGKSWADIGEAMGGSRNSGSVMGKNLSEGGSVRDTTAVTLAKALTELRGAEVTLEDILTTEAAAK